MEVQITRKTGFYGMGSPLLVKKNQKSWFSIQQNQTKIVEVTESEAIIQVSFFALKSKPFKIYPTESVLQLEIIMNPALISIYLILFFAIALSAFLKLSILGVLILLVMYIIFFFFMLKQAYIVQEVGHGTESKRFS